MSRERARPLISYEQSAAARRRVALELQKKSRAERLAAARAAQIVDEKPLPRARRFGLQRSEWMLSVPSDLHQNWLCLVRPIGRRVLLFIKNGRARAFDKSGKLVKEFVFEFSRKETALDCVLYDETSVFAMDVLIYDDYDVTECDASFRRFFLQQKLPLESKELSIKSVPFVDAPIVREELVKAYEAASAANDADGFVFVHKDSRYAERATTPLSLIWKDASVSKHLFDDLVAIGSQTVALRVCGNVLEDSSGFVVSNAPFGTHGKIARFKVLEATSNSELRLEFLQPLSDRSVPDSVTRPIFKMNASNGVGVSASDF